MSRLLGQARRFVGTIVWFFVRVARQQPLRHAALVAASGLGLVSLSVGFGVVYAVLAAVEAGDVVDVAGLSVDPTQPSNLAMIALVAAATVMVGALLVFVARQLAIDVAAAFQRELAIEVAAARGPLPIDPAMFSSDGRLLNTLTRLATGDARRCSLALRRGLDIPVPLLVTAVGFVVLFVMEPLAAAASTVFAAAVVPVMYVVNLRGVRASKRFEALVGPSRGATLALLEARATGAGDAADTASVRASLGDDPTVFPAIDAFRDRVVAALRADLTSQLVTAATTFALLVYLGIGVLDGRVSLVLLAAFMVVLRVVLGALRNVFVGIATISRHYPFLYAYRAFTRGLVTAAEPPVPAAPTPRRAAASIHEPSVPLGALPDGAVVSVSAPVTLSPLSLGFFGLVLAGGAVERAAWWRDRLVIAPDDAALPAGGDVSGTVVAIDAATLDGGRPSSGTGALVTLVCMPSKPSKSLATDLHLVVGPDGRVVAWGSVAWVRECWDDVHALRKRASESSEARVWSDDSDDDA